MSSGTREVVTPPRDQVEISGENLEVDFLQVLSPPGDGHEESKKLKPPSIKKRDSSESAQLSSGAEEWDQNVDESKFAEARLFMFELRRDEQGKFRNFSWEFFGADGIRTGFKMGRDRNVLLRVYHIQNLTSITLLEKILNKYDVASDRANFSSGQRDTIKSFSNWVFQRQPRRLAGKPLLHAQAWKLHTDNIRGVSRITFGFDYMKPYECEGSNQDEELPESRRDARAFQLSAYDQDENPMPSSDIFPQRVSVFVQRRTRDIRREPVTEAEKAKHANKKLDNGNAILLFDNANSLNAKDTLIPARSEVENEWRKMPFRYDQSCDGWGDDKVVLSAMKSIMNFLFYNAVDVWDDLLDKSWEHYTILEDQVYDQPADESRAPDLWNSSALWLKYDKLLWFHKECFVDARKHLSTIFKGEFANFLPFPDPQRHFDRLSNTLQDDLIKPTASLSDLLYKSVGIRDSRHSIQLGNSMWRLSWVTFVFLPLTFMVGFFGMNVDIFADNPKLEWYFIASVPFMLLVLIAWYVMKEFFNRHQKKAVEREALQALISGLHIENQNLWTRTGPKHTVKPIGFWSKLKWKMLVRWTDGVVEERRARTINNLNTWGEMEAQKKATKMTLWGRLKARLIRKWSKSIEVEEEELQSLNEEQDFSYEDNEQPADSQEFTYNKREGTFIGHEASEDNPLGRSIFIDLEANRPVPRANGNAAHYI